MICLPWAKVGRGLRFVDDSVPVGEGPVGAHRVPDADEDDEDDEDDVEESLARELAALTILGHLAATFKQNLDTIIDKNRDILPTYSITMK